MSKKFGNQIPFSRNLRFKHISRKIVIFRKNRIFRMPSRIRKRLVFHNFLLPKFTDFVISATSWLPDNPVSWFPIFRTQIFKFRVPNSSLKYIKLTSLVCHKVSRRNPSSSLKFMEIDIPSMPQSFFKKPAYRFLWTVIRKNKSSI